VNSYRETTLRGGLLKEKKGTSNPRIWGSDASCVWGVFFFWFGWFIFWVLCFPLVRVGSLFVCLWLESPLPLPQHGEIAFF